MRRTVIPLVIAVALAAPIGAQEKKTDLDHAGLKGRVKTVKIEQAKLSNKSGKPVEAKRVHLETQNYSDKGMLMKAVRFDAGSPTNYFYSYESNGSRLELSRTATTQSRITSEFAFDASGNRIEEIQIGDEGLVNKMVYSFDPNGRLTETRIYNKQGLFARRTYAYGADANPTQEAEYDAKGALVGKQTYSYELDSTGNWIKRITSAVGISNGKTYTEPAEVTYRTITYY